MYGLAITVFKGSINASLHPALVEISRKRNMNGCENLVKRLCGIIRNLGAIAGILRFSITKTTVNGLCREPVGFHWIVVLCRKL
jgi:hypothetical protein